MTHGVVRLGRLEQQLLGGRREDVRLEELVLAALGARDSETQVPMVRRKARGATLDRVVAAVVAQRTVRVTPATAATPAAPFDSLPHVAPLPNYRERPTVEPSAPSPRPLPATPRPWRVIPVATVWPVAQPPALPPVGVEPINVGEKILAHQRAWLERQFERPGFFRSHYDPFSRDGEKQE